MKIKSNHKNFVHLVGLYTYYINYIMLLFKVLRSQIHALIIISSSFEAQPDNG